MKSGEYELLQKIMEACGLPKLEKLTEFHLSATADKGIVIETKQRIGNSDAGVLGRTFNVKAVEQSHVEAKPLTEKEKAAMRAEWYATGFTANMLTFNDVRRMEGLPPVDASKIKVFGVPEIGSLWPHAPVQAVSSITYTDAPCPDCNGTRIYRGLTEEKPCPTCCREVQG